MNCPPWLKCDSEQITLQVKVKPGSKQNAIALDPTGCLQLSLQASAQDGKANKMLIQYLAKLLRLPQKQIVIRRGMTSRIKVLAISCVVSEQEKLIQTLMGLTTEKE